MNDIEMSLKGINAHASWMTIGVWAWHVTQALFYLVLIFHVWWTHSTQAMQDKQLEDLHTTFVTILKNQQTILNGVAKCSEKVGHSTQRRGPRGE